MGGIGVTLKNASSTAVYFDKVSLYTTRTFYPGSPAADLSLDGKIDLQDFAVQGSEWHDERYDGMAP